MYGKFYTLFRYFIFISIIMCVFNLHNISTIKTIKLILLISALAINDTIRKFKLYKNISSNSFNFSLIFSILGCYILRYNLMEIEVIPYIITILIDILELSEFQLKFYFSMHSFLFIILLLCDVGIPVTCHQFFYFVSILCSYAAIAFTSYSVNALKKEKLKVNKLNANLNLANTRLKQYALEVEELTITKERSLLAQELHDSLGHSLMALSMHLEFAENIFDTNTDKVKDIIIKSEEITKSSIRNLRESVSLLKQSRDIHSLNDSINNIINDFNILNNINFTFTTTENIDNLNRIIKNSVYKIIKESVTNSIKHGKSTEISIILSEKDNKLLINLSDNGVGCTKIIKSNGLIGIENRVNSLNGSVNYFNNKDIGFHIEICIPIL